MNVLIKLQAGAQQVPTLPLWVVPCGSLILSGIIIFKHYMVSEGNQAN